MLVISDTIKRKIKEYATTEFFLNVDTFTWKENVPRLTDYEIVVLDMKAPKINWAFIEQRDYAQNLLEHAGVIICLTYHTIETGGSEGAEHETNYSWLNGKQRTYLSILENTGMGRNIRITSRNKLISKYLEDVTVYHKTIGDILLILVLKNHMKQISMQ